MEPEPTTQNLKNVLDELTIKEFTLVIPAPLSLTKLLIQTRLCQTVNEARTAIKENRVSIDNLTFGPTIFHTHSELKNTILQIVNTNGETNKVKIVLPND